MRDHSSSILSPEQLPRPGRSAVPAPGARLSHAAWTRGLRERFGASQDFSDDGGDFADTKEQEAEDIGGGIAFGPFEVDVRLPAGYVSDVQQERGKGVRDGRAFESQHSVVDLSHRPVETWRTEENACGCLE
jgi:hypothetical protein